MSDVTPPLHRVNIEDEMKSSYLDYSMSVIIGRALPDVRDGLKPVHRRILYAMFREGMLANRRYSKCAGVVGEVLKKYHPHGDSAVYDTLVRMAQPWNMRHPLVDGQGNFGSVDGDAAAAYRYTECKMTRLAEELLADIDKETVPFIPNFDGNTLEPVVLPARFPNLLVNGSEGIAVGMATKIPPHNLAEVVNGCVALLDDPSLSVDDLMRMIPGPDFPTAATIYGVAGIKDAYRTGRGKIVIRGRIESEELGSGRQALVIHELPFQVNKARLVEDIADLVRNKRIDGIHALRDESDRQGMRVVIELKKDALPDLVTNQLYKHTLLQSTFGVILLAIVNGRPQVLTLKQMIEHFLAHRRVVTTRRIQYDLRKAKERCHILEGYRIALDHIDEVIALIRASQTAEEARIGLMARFGLSLIQAQAILDLRLQRLTGLERDKIEAEYNELLAFIADLEGILASPDRLREVMKADLLEIRDRFADARRTRIVERGSEISVEDLIAEEDQIVTLTHAGYIKRTPQTEYEVQRRGGMGRRAVTTREEDFVNNIFIANTHDALLVFTNRGRIFKLQVYELPEAGRAARGVPIVNLLPLEKDEKTASVLTVKSLEGDLDFLFISRRGYIKRTPLNQYGNIRTTGLIACDVEDGDELLAVRLSWSMSADILLTTRGGYTIRFSGDEVRPMGRVARGVKGIELREGDEVVDMEVVEGDPEMLLLTVTGGGYGKRTALTEYPSQHRGGMGVIDIKTGGRNGDVVNALQVREEDRVMLVTDTGRAIQIPVQGIRITQRNTMGVKLMRIEETERVVSIARVVDEDDSTPDTDEEAPAEE